MPTSIDRNTGIAIAKRAALERGHPWIEPTAIVARPSGFVVSSRGDTLGGNVVVVDRATGNVNSVTAHTR